MRSALLLSCEGAAATADIDGETPAERLRRQLATAGVGEVATVGTGSDRRVEVRAIRDAVAAAPAGDLLLSHADLVAHDELWDLLLDDPRLATATVSTHGDVPGTSPMRTTGARVVAPDPLGEPTGRVRHGAPVVLVGAADRDALDGALAAMGELPARVRDETLLATVVGELAHHGVAVAVVRAQGLAVSRTPDAAAVHAVAGTLAEVDGQKVLLDMAVKAKDGFFTTFFVSPYSKYIARWCARRSITPNQVTLLSLLIGLVAAGAFAVGSDPALVIGAVALQVSFTFDCVDGQLARYTRRFSPLGAWMDSMFDRAKEYAVFAGLAHGAIRHGGSPTTMWTLAVAAMAAQSVRHLVDFSFGAHRRTRADDELDDTGAETIGRLRVHAATALERMSDLVVRYSAASERLPAVKWIKRMIVFPIGERFAVISITAAVWGPRATFVVLFCWAGVALVYSLLGRILRSLR